MNANKPTLAAARVRSGARAAGARRSHDRQRRRADRRDHLVHQHVEPERDDRRRPAREEGGRGRPHGRSRTSRPRSRRARASSPSTSPRPACCPTSTSSASALAAYGCTTCIGNSGDLTPEINEAITKNDLVCAAVLSGNRNFEARIHPNLKANFLASPPLVVAYAIAGTVLKDLMTEPVGKGKGGKDVCLGDIWPTQRRGPRADEVRDGRQGLPQELREGRERAGRRSGNGSRA